jgi:hypothetical protein
MTDYEKSLRHTLDMCKLITDTTDLQITQAQKHQAEEITLETANNLLEYQRHNRKGAINMRHCLPKHDIQRIRNMLKHDEELADAITDCILSEIGITIDGELKDHYIKAIRSVLVVYRTKLNLGGMT